MDCETEADFQAQLELLKDVWDEREKAHMPAGKQPSFHKYICEKVILVLLLGFNTGRPTCILDLAYSMKCSRQLNFVNCRIFVYCENRLMDTISKINPETAWTGSYLL